jgi:hypothetical protein
MAVLLEGLNMPVRLDALWKILFERSGARVETDAQVISWVHTAGFSGPSHRRLTAVVERLCAMDVRSQGQSIRLRLKTMPP